MIAQPKPQLMIPQEYLEWEEKQPIKYDCDRFSGKKSLRDRFTPDTLNYICPGANTGALRGKGTIERAYQRLTQLELDKLQDSQPWL